MTWFCFPVKVAAKSGGALAKSTVSLARPFHHTGGVKGRHYVWKKKATGFTAAKTKIVLACILIPGTAIPAIPFIPPDWVPSIPGPSINVIPDLIGFGGGGGLFGGIRPVESSVRDSSKDQDHLINPKPIYTSTTETPPKDSNLVNVPGPANSGIMLLLMSAATIFVRRMKLKRIA